ncbi:hypothetical protein CBR_g4534 [Chara braunii]|uniref:Uncharacterized protein n=1 Tax=Chara braunii TaxID=69332 RepID=A0A388KI35_CHABU|nr:hypothetical protein CBR_g4534 [Chara braunii]|eukprot:GBG69702.1 hypothetical protein CBR_g4534 [Chara braunii]
MRNDSSKHCRDLKRESRDLGFDRKLVLRACFAGVGGGRSARGAEESRYCEREKEGRKVFQPLSGGGGGDEELVGV